MTQHKHQLQLFDLSVNNAGYTVNTNRVQQREGVSIIGGWTNGNRLACLRLQISLKSENLDQRICCLLKRNLTTGNHGIL